MALNISEFLTALNEGEQAKAAVPALQAQVTDLQVKLDAAQRHSQGLEENIRAYRSTIDELQEKVRSLVVERDDASFRGLEVQDKLDTLLKAVRAVGGTLHDASDRADPPKAPEPAPQPVPVAPVLSEASPTTAAAPAPSQGQSESPPSAPSTDGSQPSAGESGAGSTGVSGSKPAEPKWPYEGAPEMKPVSDEEAKPLPSLTDPFEKQSS